MNMDWLTPDEEKLVLRALEQVQSYGLPCHDELSDEEDATLDALLKKLRKADRSGPGYRPRKS